MEDGAWTASAELREVPRGQLRLAPDSPLEESRFELLVPVSNGGNFWRRVIERYYDGIARPIRCGSDGVAQRPIDNEPEDIRSGRRILNRGIGYGA